MIWAGRWEWLGNNNRNWYFIPYGHYVITRAWKYHDNYLKHRILSFNSLLGIESRVHYIHQLKLSEQYVTIERRYSDSNNNKSINWIIDFVDMYLILHYLFKVIIYYSPWFDHEQCGYCTIYILWCNVVNYLIYYLLQ